MRKGTMLVGQGLAVRRVKRRPGCVTAWANSSSVVSISVVKTTARSRRVKRGPGCVTAWSRVGSTQVYWSPLHHKPQTCNDQQSYTYYTAPICRQLIYYTHTQYNNKNIVYVISKKKVWRFFMLTFTCMVFVYIPSFSFTHAIPESSLSSLSAPR